MFQAVQTTQPAADWGSNKIHELSPGEKTDSSGLQTHLAMKAHKVSLEIMSKRQVIP